MVQECRTDAVRGADRPQDCEITSQGCTYPAAERWQLSPSPREARSRVQFRGTDGTEVDL
jgi:hypothetical protein